MGTITPQTLAMGQADLYYLTTTHVPNEFKFYIVPGGEIINHGPPDVRGRVSVQPEDWQLAAVSEVNQQVPLFFNLKVEETLDRNSADYELVFSSVPNTSYVSGMQPNLVFTIFHTKLERFDLFFLYYYRYCRGENYLKAFAVQQQDG